MVHRGTTREPRLLRTRSESTSADKFRRHRNKKRIWRRAVRRIEASLTAYPPVEAAPIGAASLSINV